MAIQLEALFRDPPDEPTASGELAVGTTPQATQVEVLRDVTVAVAGIGDPTIQSNRKSAKPLFNRPRFHIPCSSGTHPTRLMRPKEYSNML